MTSPAATKACNHRQKPLILYLVTRGILGGPYTHINHLVPRIKQEFRVAVAVGARGRIANYLADPAAELFEIPSLVQEIAPLSDFKAIGEIEQLIRRLQPDLVSTHSSKAGLLGRIAAKRCGVPAIFTAHGWAFTEGVSRVARWLYIIIEKIAACWAAKIICVSEHDRRLALKHRVGRPHQLVTIHNGMPVEALPPLAEPGKANPVRLIMVARFCDQKDQSLLFKALARLKTGPEFELVLVGDGPLLTKCQKQVQQLGLAAQVKFLGGRTDVPELLQQAQIFLLISKWEGFPRSILEAMRAGLPVIASDVGGTREEVLDGTTGFLIPRGNLEQLVKALRLLINDPELRSRMGRQGYEYFKANFTFDRLLAKTTQIYLEIMKQRENRTLVSGPGQKLRAL